MASVENMLASKFRCAKCDHTGARVEQLAMSGTGLSRLLEIQNHRYLFVSCENCGYTEVFNSDTLSGKDNLGSFLEVLFMD